MELQNHYVPHGWLCSVATSFSTVTPAILFHFQENNLVENDVL